MFCCDCQALKALNSALKYFCRRNFSVSIQRMNRLAENHLFDIDGSVLEGGGQILRMSLCFSVLTKTPVRIRNIRQGRKKPGLAAQHLAGVELMRDICQGRVHKAALGSTEIEFYPGHIGHGRFVGHIQTAGSITLLLQATLPVAIFSSGPVTLDLRGGTNTDLAPQVDFLTEIFRPNMERFGASFDFDLVRRGYFPKGGGQCVVEVRPVQSLRPISLVDVGTVTRFFGWSFVAGVLPLKIAHEMSTGAKSILNQITGSRADIEIYKESIDMAPEGNCSGIIVGCETSTGAILGGSALGEARKKSFQSGEEAANEIHSALSVGACVDRHVQDMMIILMALADGKSRIRTEPLTMHTRTAIYVTELMTKAKFNIIEEDGRNVIIECVGIGLRNVNLLNTVRTH
ncbi:RNA 3'-terminal phosphate cyclase [Anopheles funestus]|uniref:RNA 3'-terminal phosphate cyclase n=1 Tax=Anopheles funestus TaxID=62324 RepID=UPI0020C5E8BF|nr:RNA 3'-terminal phosphate cyclase [Anopheles funestus]XP_049296116.1 RNA 3'-terminal phosphate cyclase [Anopheles funestus]XP_049296117.1 RNA 3'-terminal phosphate cyclase [Anopheles funestus]